MRDLVDHQPLTGCINEIQHVVERARQAVNVFAIERSDKGLIEFGQDIVGHLVAEMLNVFEFLDAGLYVFEIIQSLLKEARPIA